MSNEIDDLMSLDPLELANSPDKLRQVIAFMRQARANWDAGVKPTKEKKEGKGGALVNLLKQTGAIKVEKENRRA